MLEPIKLWSNEDFEFEADEIFLEQELKYLVDLIIDYADNKDELLIYAKNSNWKGQDGHKIIDLNMDKIDVYNQIVPEYDNTFILYKDGNDLYAIVSSHDVPTGSVWYFKGLSNVELTINDSLNFLEKTSKSIEEFTHKIQQEIEDILDIVLDLNIYDETNIFIEENDYKLYIIGDSIFEVKFDELNHKIENIYFDHERLQSIYVEAIIESLK